MEQTDFRPMGSKYSPGRTQINFQVSSSNNGNKDNQISKLCTKTMYIRRGRRLIKKVGNRSSSEGPGRSRFLQHFLHCSKEGRRSSSNFESKAVKCLSEKSTFQNGNSALNNSSVGTGRLGSVIGLKGCISTYSNVPPRQTVSSILYSRQTLPVQSDAIWTGDSATGIYETDGSCRRFSTNQADPHFHVFGRLAHQEHQQGASYESFTTDTRSVDRRRSGSECKKIATSTVPEDYLLGGRFSPLEGCCSTNSGEIPQFMREYSRFSAGSIYSGSCVPSSSWTHGSLHRFGPYGQTTYAAYPVVPVVAVAPPCGQYSSNDTDKGTSDSSSLVVDSTSEHIQRNVNSVIHSTGNCLDRRLNDGVGSTYEQQNGVWRVVRNHATPSYQHAGDDGSEECFASFPISSAQQTSSNQNGQFNSGDIHKPSRRDAVTQTVHVDMGDPSVVLSEQNIASGGPHTRQEEHFGRRSVQGAASYEDDGMESISEPGRSPLLSVRATEHRSVCNEGQSQSDSVLFPISRSGSMGMRCVGSELDRNVRLCVPPTNSSTKSAKESVAGDLCSTSCCSVLPKTVMAPSIIGASGRISKNSPSFGKHADSAKRTGLSSRSKQSKANRLENFKGHNSPKKFSAKVERYILGSRRQSTRKMYDARLGIYKSWCTSRKISPYKTSVSQVADFLVYLHEDRQCKAGTIAGYRSAIASIHQGWQNSTVSNNADLSKLIKGIFNTSPNIKPLLPNWDLPTVLWALCDFPFEPINSAEMKYVTWKTVFLVALASASRVSEIQALSVGKSHLRYEKDGIRLLPNIQFLAKTQRLGKPWTPVFIPEFNQFATDSRDLLLCPCRAIRMYIRRTENIRSVSECLFLTYQPGQSRPASKSTISKWIVSLIKFVYERHNERLDSVRAHDTRRLATSWALFNGASVQEIMQAAHWVNESTFTSFYMRDVPQDDVRFARSSVLETARWAKKHN